MSNLRYDDELKNRISALRLSTPNGGNTFGILTDDEDSDSEVEVIAEEDELKAIGLYREKPSMFDPDETRCTENGYEHEEAVEEKKVSEDLFPPSTLDVVDHISARVSNMGIDTSVVVATEKQRISSCFKKKFLVPKIEAKSPCRNFDSDSEDDVIVLEDSASEEEDSDRDIRQMQDDNDKLNGIDKVLNEMAIEDLGSAATRRGSRSSGSIGTFTFRNEHEIHSTDAPTESMCGFDVNSLPSTESMNGLTESMAGYVHSEGTESAPTDISNGFVRKNGINAASLTESMNGFEYSESGQFNQKSQTESMTGFENSQEAESEPVGNIKKVANAESATESMRDFEYSEIENGNEKREVAVTQSMSGFDYSEEFASEEMGENAVTENAALTESMSGFSECGLSEEADQREDCEKETTSVEDFEILDTTPTDKFKFANADTEIMEPQTNSEINDSHFEKMRNIAVADTVVMDQDHFVYVPESIEKETEADSEENKEKSPIEKMLVSNYFGEPSNHEQSVLAEDSFIDNSLHGPGDDGSLTIEETCSESDNEQRMTEAKPVITETVNISAKINIKIQFSQQYIEQSDEENTESSENSSHPMPDNSLSAAESSRNSSLAKAEQSVNNISREEPTKNPNMSTGGNSSSISAADFVEVDERMMKSAMASPECEEDKENDSPNSISSPSQNPAEFDMQAKLLTKLYGNAWKTPDVIKTLKKANTTGRRRRPFQEESVADFSVFRQRVAVDLESTRISPTTDGGQDAEPSGNKKGSGAHSKGNDRWRKVVDSESSSSEEKSPELPQKRNTVSAESVKKVIAQENANSAQTRKTVLTRKGRVVKQRWQDLVDSDTSLQEDANDDSYLDETKASSSDAEIEEKPKARAAKPKAKGRRKKAGDITYLDLSKEEVEVSNDNPSSPPANHDENFQNHLKSLLDSCKFVGKPKLTPTPVKTKRKLFTPRVGSEDEMEPPPEEPKPTTLSRKKSLDEVVNISIPLPAKFNLVNKQLEAARTGKPISEIKSNPLSTPARSSKLAINVPSTPADKYGFLRSLDVCVSKNLCHPDALVYRNNFKSRKEELADMLYKLYNEKCFKNELNVPLVWNKKLLCTAGRCVNRKRMGIRCSEIELSEKVLTSADRLRCTLIHELCHAATWIFHGDNGHGATWKAWAHKANKAFPELPKITVCHAYDIEYKYTYKCTLCGAKSHAHSKSKKVENIRCSFCHGTIEIFLNKKDKDGNVIPTPTKEPKGFAKFVKEKYQAFKKPDIKHAEVMKLLSSAFASLDVAEKQKY